MKDDNDLTEVQKLRQAMAKNTNKDYMKRLNEDNSDIEMPESLSDFEYPFFINGEVRMTKKTKNPKG